MVFPSKGELSRATEDAILKAAADNLLKWQRLILGDMVEAANFGLRHSATVLGTRTLPREIFDAQIRSLSDELNSLGHRVNVSQEEGGRYKFRVWW